MNLANEGFEARKKEEEVATKKRKVEEDANWEGMRLYYSTLVTLCLILYSKPRTTCGQLEKFLKDGKEEKETKGWTTWIIIGIFYVFFCCL
jgi:hypothetical protein